MRSIVEQVESIVECRSQKAESKDQSTIAILQSPIYIYCWRGGMRSGAMAWLLQLYGFKVMLLAGGYKSFRRWSIEQFSYPYQLRILGGFTGSGKTEVLKQLRAQGEAVVDLEGLAQHKGSAFGNLGNTQQPSQEMFENLLALAIHKALQEKESELEAIWIEDESQRIGLNNIPSPFWTNMRNAPVYFLNIPFEERLQHLTEEYGIYSKESLAEGIQRISKRLGGLETKNALQDLEAGNIKGCFRTLLTYYDKFYLKGLHNRAGLTSLLTDIPCSTVSSDNAQALLTLASTI
jgi:tRNA 2-selenouridine synthase